MSGKTRVLFAIGSLAGGGSERQVVAILKHLDRTRFTPLLYAVSRSGELLDHVPPDVPFFAFSDRHRESRSRLPGTMFRRQAADLARVIREHTVDVVYDRTYFMTLISARATRRIPVPRISTIVCDPERDVQLTAQRFVALKKWLLRRGYQTAFRVVTNSEDLRQTAMKYYRLSPEKIVTIPNLLDIDEVERLSRDNSPPWPAGRTHVVTAGRLHPQKGQRELIAAAEELVHRRDRASLQFHIFGTGALRDELQQMIRDRHLEDHVLLEGFADNIYARVRRADLFCLPSLYEGMPNALIEAMACGTPVLSTDCPTGPREVLQGGRLGRLVPPGDSAALADAIEEFLDDAATWTTRAVDAQQFIRQEFAPATVMEKLEQLLESTAFR